MDGRAKRVTGPLTRRQKRMMAAVGGVAVAALGGLSIWGVAHPGSYGRSGNGCISVSVPSSTGGAIMHGCGARAQSMCQSAYAHTDTVSRLTQTQCRIAGLGPTPAASP